MIHVIKILIVSLVAAASLLGACTADPRPAERRAGNIGILPVPGGR